MQREEVLGQNDVQHSLVLSSWGCKERVEVSKLKLGSHLLHHSSRNPAYGPGHSVTGAADSLSFILSFITPPHLQPQESFLAGPSWQSQTWGEGHLSADMVAEMPSAPVTQVSPAPLRGIKF